MTRTHTISARRRTPAPAGTVWDLLTDVASWPAWGPFDDGALEHRPDGDPGGAGMVRRAVHGRTTTLENVVAHEPERHFAYEMYSGVPLRDHMSEVHLSEADGHTNIDWRATYRVVVPGTANAYERRLAGFLDQLVTALSREAERRHAST